MHKNSDEAKFPRIEPQTVAALVSLFDDPESGQEFLRDLVATFSSCGKEVVRDLRESLKRNDQVKLTKLAHKLKGLSRNIGAERLGRICQHLESEAMGAPLERIAALYTAINSEFIASLDDLNETVAHRHNKAS